MKALIVCVSISHGNTRKVADVMADVLDARVVEPEDVDPTTIENYDLVGFGSGVYFMALHPRLRTFAKALPSTPGRKAFLFATSGSPELLRFSYLWPVERVLAGKGIDVVGTFSCRGYDTWLPFRLVGGINKGRPDDVDLTAARTFAKGLPARVERSRLGGALDPTAHAGG